MYVLDIPVTATVSELPAGRSPVLRNRAVVRVSNLHEATAAYANTQFII